MDAERAQRAELEAAQQQLKDAAAELERSHPAHAQEVAARRADLRELEEAWGPLERQQAAGREALEDVERRAHGEELALQTARASDLARPLVMALGVAAGVGLAAASHWLHRNLPDRVWDALPALAPALPAFLLGLLLALRLAPSAESRAHASESARVVPQAAIPERGNSPAFLWTLAIVLGAFLCFVVFLFLRGVTA